MSGLNEAALVPGPGPTYQDTTSTILIYTIPSELIGMYVRLATDASIQYKFGVATADVNLTLDQASGATGSGTTGSPIVLTVNAATGERLEGGTHTDFVIETSWRYFGIVSESGDANWTLRKAQMLT